MILGNRVTYVAGLSLMNQYAENDTRIESKPSRMKIQAQALQMLANFYENNTRISLLSANTLHLSNSPCQDATESASECSSREEQRHAETTLALAVPHGDVVIHTWEKTALKDTQEDASSHKSSFVLDESLADHSGRPKHHDKSYPNRRTQSFHHHTSRVSEFLLKRHENLTLKGFLQLCKKGKGWRDSRCSRDL